jgi:hypothetical protein
LLEDVFGDDAKCVFSLHELEAAGGAGEEVGEAGALVGGYELCVIFGAGDGWRELRNGGVA